MVGSLIVVGLLPIIKGGNIIGMSNRPLSKILYWGLIGDMVLLTFIGSRPVEDPYIIIGQCGAIYYYMYFMVMVMGVSRWEDKLMGALR